jgi:hypothetical protein
VVTSIDVEIGGGRADRRPVALVTSTGVSFSGGPGDEHRWRPSRSSTGGAALVTSIDGTRPSRASTSRAGPVVTSTGVSGGPRGDEHAPALDRAEHGRQLQPVALVTSIDVEISGGRAGRQPAAPVTSTGVSFTLRTSTKPRTLDRAEHDRQLQPVALVTNTGGPVVSFTLRPPRVRVLTRQ